MEVTKGYLTLSKVLTMVPPVQASAIATGTIAVTEVDAHQTGYTAAAGAELTVALQPTYARGVVLWFTDGDSSADHVGSVTVRGVDANGAGITETLALPSTTGHTHGTEAFAQINSVNIHDCTGTYGENDHVSLGYDQRFGLPSGPGGVIQSLLFADFNGAPDAGTFSASTAMYTVAGTMNAVKEVSIGYIAKVPIVQ